MKDAVENDRVEDPSYPAALREAEHVLVEARRRWLAQREGGNGPSSTKREPRPPDLASDRAGAAPSETLTDGGASVGPRVGVALSGGGIRSATFALGFFQALAKRDLLPHIDYLSTVSGGGYFGGFYGRMFHRRKVVGNSRKKKVDVDDVAEKLRPDWAPSVEAGKGRDDWHRLKPVKWLRENGRYLAPNGAGDTLVAASVLFRNWVAIWIAIGSAILTLLLAMLYVRTWLETSFVELCVTSPDLFVCPSTVDGWDPLRWTIPGGAVLWASPLFVIPVVLALFTVVPLAWAYWLTPASEVEARRRVMLRWVATLAWLTVAALSWGFTFGEQSIRSDWSPEVSLPIATAVIVVGALAYGAMVWVPVAALSRWITRRWVLSGFCGVVIALSGLLYALDLSVTIVALLVLAVALGSTWVLVGTDAERALPRRISSVFAGALAAVGLFVAIASIDSLGQTMYAVMTAPGSTAFAWFVAVASGLGLSGAGARKAATSLYQLFAKRTKPSLSIPAAAVAVLVGTFTLVCFSVVSHAIAHDFEQPKHAPSVLTETAEEECAGKSDAECMAIKSSAESTGGVYTTTQLRAALRTLEPRRDGLFGGLGLAFFTALLTGGSLSFINRSSHLPLYKARLVRAYLGASNGSRLSLKGEDVTRVFPDDDLAMDEYWSFAWGVQSDARKHHEETGAPLHIVNVTINETLLGPSKIQEQDRRGTGLGLGPCGLSAGIRHHLVRRCDVESRASGERKFEVHPLTSDAQAYQVFDANAQPESLSLGHWLGISGAAFTTGLGFRTSLGLSMLLGMANVRLGHWWNSNVVRVRVPSWLRGFAAFLGGAVFVVQRHLFKELSARFPGTAEQHWYLSDGGHFENTGAYELIRRRLPVIIVVDASADPDSQFEDLANLIRKARLDFNATIQFRPGTTPKGTSATASTLDDLKPRKSEGDRPGDPLPTSNGHAALAKITYSDQSTGWLLYIKPTIVGDEPRDVLQYRDENPAFPHEPTVDQFFDEAQWESYRRLGQHIGEVLTDKTTPVVHPDANETLRTLLAFGGRKDHVFAPDSSGSGDLPQARRSE